MKESNLQSSTENDLERDEIIRRYNYQHLEELERKYPKRDGTGRTVADYEREIDRYTTFLCEHNYHGRKSRRKCNNLVSAKNRLKESQMTKKELRQEKKGERKIEFIIYFILFCFCVLVLYIQGDL